jgi:16S rRNA processing protein RimM
MQLVVGRIAKAHGIGGEVAVDVRTDDPEHRYAAGASLATDPSERGPLVVEQARWHAGRLLVRFAGIADRSAAERLRGTLLVADSATSAAVGDPDEYWDHDLLGLCAVLADGPAIGTVSDVVHPSGPDLLVIGRADGSEVLVPFVREIVPVVDVAAGRLVLTPPEGLLEL